MIADKKKQIEFVSKLVEMTQHDKLDWSATKPLPHHDYGLPNPAIMSFISRLGYKTLRITRTNVPYAQNPLTAGFWMQAEKPPTQLTQIMLELYDSDGNLTFEFPGIQGITDLFESVASQAADVDDFIQDVLSRK